jgi:hypothetical protein
MAWMLIYIINLVHREDMLHNDLSPPNILFFYDAENSKVFVGFFIWSVASHMRETCLLMYGTPNKNLLNGGSHETNENCHNSLLCV